MANSLVKRIWGTAVSKTDDKRLPVIDMEKNLESLKPSDKYYYKKFNRLNKERWEVHTAHRKSHNKFATVLAIFSVGIYFYTLFAVRQEKFLDEGFDEVPDNAVKNT
ncbi:Hypothetical predicted protein [Mytilus galloprovincialis]|uniref:Cytochrome c oxidase assembly factor 3 mitochondrial coiled-coil domain-containing protein n=1 Tax=Mytilus galloprovincialis TaxID=29158 RepID=A0A8B6F180_MYTGA|nr:Hypothetical predicted protein [Mytilus galloprovincialis]